MTVESFFSMFMRHQKRNAFVRGGQRVSYEELLARCTKLLRALQQRGIGAGQQVGLMSNDSLAFVQGFVALWELGVNVVPMEKRLSIEQQVEFAKEVELHSIVTVTFEEIRIHRFREQHTATWLQKQKIYKEGEYFTLFTSGSSAKCKGVVLKKAAAFNNAHKVVDYTGISKEDRCLLTLPLNYSFALSHLFVHFMVGAEIVLPDRSLAPLEILQHLEDFDVTNYPATPYFYEGLFREIAGNTVLPSLSKMRLWMNAGGFLHKKIIKEIVNRFGHIEFYNNYGQTEAGPRLCFSRFRKGATEFGGLDTSLPGVSLRLMADDVVGVGEVAYQSEDIMVGYYRKELIEPHAFFPSGDLGYFDAHGALHLVGRVDSMIKVGGRKVFLKEIEERLIDLESIRCLQIKRMHDRSFGEYLGLYVVKNSQFTDDRVLQDIRRECTSLSIYERPKKVIFVDSVGLTNNQKIHLAQEAGSDFCELY